MIFLETILYVFVAFVVNPGRGDFDERKNGICLKTETYYSTVYEFQNVQVPMTERRWCWNPGEWFKCLRTTYKSERRRVPKVLPRTKTVKTCCDGYIEDQNRWKFSCIPQCFGECSDHGICSAPDVCMCFPGYVGPICEEECPRGLWGENCSEECECVNGGECDAVFGVCSCKPGWRGDRCELPCPAGFRGAECEEQIDCVDESNGCNNLTTTTEEEKTSTTEVTVTTTDIFTTESETEETYLDAETTSTESIETTTTVPVVSATETTTSEQIETTSVTETTEASVTETTEAFATETTQTEGATETSTEETLTVQEKISERKTLGNSFGMYRKTGLYGNKSEELNSNKLPEEPRVPTTTVKVSVEEDAAGRENFGLDREREIEEPTENERRQSSRLIYFVPSLTVLSGVSVVMFLIATRWLIVRHRKKVRKMAVEMEEKIFHPDGQRKCRIESIFLVNDCAEIPVYVSGSCLNDKAPVLQTFKPLPDPPTKGSDAN